MKIKARLVTILCAILTTVAFAEPLERVTLAGISLNVASATVKAVATNQFKTNYGSSDVHTDRVRSIAGSVTNRTRTEAKVVVTIFWFGKKTGGNERVVLPASEYREITLAPGAAWKLESSTGTVAAQDMKLVAIGERYTGGSTIEGWVVTVRSAGKLVGCVGSQGHLEEIVRSGASAKLEMAGE